LQLTAAQHQALAKRVATVSLQATLPAVRPVAVFSAGQPGAGKIHAIVAPQRQRFASDGIAVVDAQVIRFRIPKAPAVALQLPADLPLQAFDDADAVAQLVAQQTLAGNRNILVGGTLADAGHAVGQVENFRRAGYRVEVHAMAVYPDLSRARTFQRRESEIHCSGKLADIVPDRHDWITQAFTDTIDRLQQNGAVDRIAVFDRSGQSLLDLRNVERGCWRPTANAREVLQRAQHCPNPPDVVDAALTWRRVEQSMQARAASATELDQVRQYKDLALNRVHHTLAARQLIAQAMPKDSNVPGRAAEWAALGRELAARAWRCEPALAAQQYSGLKPEMIKADAIVKATASTTKNLGANDNTVRAVGNAMADRLADSMAQGKPLPHVKQTGMRHGGAEADFEPPVR
jgi:hypothetical protein